jgi:hypothetical protein
MIPASEATASGLHRFVPVTVPPLGSSPPMDHNNTLPLWSLPDPADWSNAMPAELMALRSAILRVGLLAAGMACSPEERARLQLLAHEDPAGITTANMRELQVHVLEITRDVAVYAQAAVSQAAAGPDDPRRQEAG